MSHIMNRRQFPRFETPPMYHAISVREMDCDKFKFDGHAYNISEGGIQFELDDPVAPGTEIAMMIHLPRGFDTGPGRGIFVKARVIWITDVEEPGPIRHAASFDGYFRAGDAERLARYLTGNRFRLAA